MLQSLQSMRINASEGHPAAYVTSAFLDAVSACGSVEALVAATEHLRSARVESPDLALSLMPFFDQWPLPSATDVFTRIVRRFFAAGDCTRFGLAITIAAVAREARKPELRWRLETLAGSVAAEQAAFPRKDHSGVEELLASFHLL